MSLEVLPPKIYMETLADELGLSELKKVKAFQTLLEYKESDDLNLYFDQDVFGKKSDEEILQHHIDDPNLYLTDSSLSVISGSKCIGRIDVKLIDDGESLCVGALSFSQNGTHYYVVYQGDPFPLYYSDIYVLRDEYLDFRTRMTSYKSDKQKTNTNHSKRPSKPEQRITAFKYWLVGNSGKSIHSDEDLQSCYKDLGEPTRDKIWECLQQSNIKLFSSGKDDFKKAIGKVVPFKTGTGKNRSS